MGMSRWLRCRASAGGDVARASCPLGHGRPARATRRGRDGHGTKNVTPGRSNHPAPGRAHSSASVIDAIEIKDEGKLGREALGPHCGRAMGVSRWLRCRASAVGDVARASCPLGRGRPARAHRHARDGDGAKSVASGAANHPAAGRGHSPVSVIDAIEIKDEEKLGRPGNQPGADRARSPHRLSTLSRLRMRKSWAERPSVPTAAEPWA